MTAAAAWKRWLLQNAGFAGAVLLLLVLALTYNMLHPRGFSSAVAVQNANETAAIAFVAMAQPPPVLTQVQLCCLDAKTVRRLPAAAR